MHTQVETEELRACDQGLASEDADGGRCVAIRGCTVVAVEGPQAAGKTALAHALTAALIERGLVAAYVPEPAASSPFVEEFALHGYAADTSTELDLLTAQMSAQLRAARYREVLVCDKTVFNVLAHCSEVLPPEAARSALMDAMRRLAMAWGSAYDRVFLCADRFTADADPFRDRLRDRQDKVAAHLEEEFSLARAQVVPVPRRLSTTQRVRFCLPIVANVMPGGVAAEPTGPSTNPPEFPVG
jgi:hypothetical protein